MALKVQSAFSAGELDPALWERTELAKYKTGMKTARNVVVHKTGRLISRPGRSFFATTKFANSRCVLYSPPNSGYLLEWGNLYVRVYSISAAITGSAYGTLLGDYSHPLTSAQLDQIKFTSNGNDIWIFCGGNPIQKFNPLTGFYSQAGIAYPTNQVFGLPYFAQSVSYSYSASGYPIDYAITVQRSGQESPAVYIYNVPKLPINVGESVTIQAVCAANSTNSVVTGINVYRRPAGGGAFGYVGSSSASTGGLGTPYTFTFTDIGGAADYTHTLPTMAANLVVRGFVGPQGLNSQCGTIFQQRLLLANFYQQDQLFASRTGFTQDFTQSYPISSDSALGLRCGTVGNPSIIDMIENDGLNVFTSVGLFLFTGAMGPDDLALTKKGAWVLDSLVPPLAVPGGVLFLDSATNSVRILKYSTEAGGYLGEEVSIYSNHLFQGKKVRSWAFQYGDLPIVWMSMYDGTFLSFTYVEEQEMRAWTRHDSSVNVEYVAGTGLNGITAFLTEENGVRNIEITVPRYTSSTAAAADAQWMINQPMAAMDSITTVRARLNDNLTGTDQVVVRALTKQVSNPLDDNWAGPLNINCGTSSIFGSPAYVGQTLRFFDSDYSVVDLVVTARDALGNNITVQPSTTFPSTSATGPNLYATFNAVNGLGYMEGEYAAVIVDGYVFSSPNNDDQEYPQLQVTNGTLTLPYNLRGAIIHVGRPITFDMETLDIETVEQRPVLIESKILNKAYIKTLNTSGLYAGIDFPNDPTSQAYPNGVAGMIDCDSIVVQPGNTTTQVIGNAYQQPTSKRIELSVPGDWESNGRFCLRQVDPLHFEVLSIIPDLNDLRR